MQSTFRHKTWQLIKVGLVLFGLGVTVLGHPRGSLWAQTMPIDLAVSPPTHYLHVNPGKTVTHTVTLEQHGSLPLEVTPNIVDFESDGLTGQPQLKFRESSSFAHITIQDSTLQLGQVFTLNPGQKKQITFRISPPADATQAEYPLTLLFIAKPDQKETIITGSQVSGIIGSNLIVYVGATEEDKSKLSLKEIQTPRLIDSFASLAFSLLAENTGRNATTASGAAQVRNWQGQIVAEYTVYPDMVLAKSTRLLRTGSSIEADDPDQITSEFKYKPVFLIGPYTISAQLAETGQASDFRSTASSTVFAFPFSLVAILLLGIILYGSYRLFIKDNQKINL